MVPYTFITLLFYPPRGHHYLKGLTNEIINFPQLFSKIFVHIFIWLQQVFRCGM